MMDNNPGVTAVPAILTLVLGILTLLYPSFAKHEIHI